jgi:hypothetical protein
MYKNANNNNNGNDDDSEESGSGWISWFCDLEGHEFFIEVCSEYIHELEMIELCR